MAASVIRGAILAGALLALSPSAAQSPAPSETVSVAFSLVTDVTAGAVFVDWSDGKAERDLAATAFTGKPAATPVTLSFAAPAEAGEFRIYVIGKKARRYSFAPLRVVIRPGTSPQLTADDAENRPMKVTLRD